MLAPASLPAPCCSGPYAEVRAAGCFERAHRHLDVVAALRRLPAQVVAERVVKLSGAQFGEKPDGRRGRGSHPGNGAEGMDAAVAPAADAAEGGATGGRDAAGRDRGRHGGVRDGAAAGDLDGDLPGQ